MASAGYMVGSMLRGIAHVHFREGERGPGEATLGFEKALSLAEYHGVRDLVATFHLRHPSDLRLATPGKILDLVEAYRGPVKIAVMPEANMVYREGSAPRVMHDIDSWRDLDVEHEQFGSIVQEWIVSAHFTKALGWTREQDGEGRTLQTYDLIAELYEDLMHQPWRGWIGHPFRHCTGPDPTGALRRLYQVAVETGHVVELRADDADNPERIQSALIAEFSHKTTKPLIAISIDAHHAEQFESGITQSRAVAELLVARGVRPDAIWDWE